MFIALFAGEIMICRVADVSRTLLYSTVRDEPLGTLYVTNFRVIFVLKNQSPVNESVRARDLLTYCVYVATHMFTLSH